VWVTTTDDGPGFAAGIIDRIGDPYVTTRGRAGGERADHEAGGLGLGFFIAKTLLERTGATLHLANRPEPRTGAIVRVEWPRALVDTLAESATTAETMPAAKAWRGQNEPL
jgi:two-component system sensor histidine kinase RegB